MQQQRQVREWQEKKAKEDELVEQELARMKNEGVGAYVGKSTRQVDKKYIEQLEETSKQVAIATL